MKTDVINDLKFHYSKCGMYEAEQETKHFFYINDVRHKYVVGQVDVKDKEFRPASDSSWFKQDELENLVAFLKEIYEHYKHVR